MGDGGWKVWGEWGEGRSGGDSGLSMGGFLKFF